MNPDNFLGVLIKHQDSNPQSKIDAIGFISRVEISKESISFYLHECSLPHRIVSVEQIGNEVNVETESLINPDEISPIIYTNDLMKGFSVKNIDYGHKFPVFLTCENNGHVYGLRWITHLMNAHDFDGLGPTFLKELLGSEFELLKYEIDGACSLMDLVEKANGLISVSW